MSGKNSNMSGKCQGILNRLKCGNPGITKFKFTKLNVNLAGGGRGGGSVVAAEADLAVAVEADSVVVEEDEGVVELAAEVKNKRF